MTGRALTLTTILFCATYARAVDIPVNGLKLIIVDKLALAGKAKMTFIVKDNRVAKGGGTDPNDIDGFLDVAYDGTSGTFVMPAGAGWITNDAGAAKYVNKAAPTGGSVKTSVIKNGTILKVAARSLGDTPLDISQAPSGPVFAAHTLTNGGETTRHCTAFSACEHKVIAAGTGSKLACRVPGLDIACLAACPLAGRYVDQGATVLDSCRGYEWEKKDTLLGSGPNAGNLHDVDNQYAWAGHCSLAPSKLCQPSADAEALCKAQTAMAAWTVGGCEQCAGGEGVCTIDAPALTTVWSWLDQVNDSAFAGHSDWRLPTSGGFAGSTGEPSELDSLADARFVSGVNPALEPSSLQAWSASTTPGGPPFLAAAKVIFPSQQVVGEGKETAVEVRAIR